jgi:hypothetical protein
MVPLDYVLAVAALTVAPGAGDKPPPAKKLAHLRPAVRQVALSWELLDRRELTYVLAREEDFDADLDFLRQRRRNLADAPPLDDCLRFPDRTLACDYLAFNRAYRKHLARREMTGTPWPEEVRAAMRETDQLYDVWDALRDARSECYYVTVRREALKALRERIGPAAYAFGALPPHVPVWRFSRAD